MEGSVAVGPKESSWWFTPRAAWTHERQTYALTGSRESRLTAAERQSLLEGERKLKDDQEELWRAHLILIDIARNSPDKLLARKSALLSAKCLQQISDRFGRRDEIRQAGIELARLLNR